MSQLQQRLLDAASQIEEAQEANKTKPSASRTEKLRRAHDLVDQLLSAATSAHISD